MSKIDCITDYFLANKANAFFFLGLIYRNQEYAEVILESKYLTGAKLGCIANILLSIKEEIVENKGNLLYESKLFINELENTVEVIAKKENNGYKIDNYLFSSASNVVATIRNKIAHGDYEIDFVNNYLILNIENNNVKINIEKLSLFVAKALQKIFRSIKTDRYERDIALFEVKENKRKTPLKLKSEIKNIVRKFKNVKFNFSKEGVLEAQEIELIEWFLSNYKATRNPELINAFRNLIKTNKIELEVEETRVRNERDVDALTELIMNTIVPDHNYDEQMLMIGFEMQRFLNDKYNKFNPLMSSLNNLVILDAISNSNSVDLEKVGQKLPDEKLYLNYDILATSAINMFNSLFSYSFDDLYKNNFEYTVEDNNGLDYSKLDLGLIKVEMLELDVNVLNGFQEKRDSLKKKIAEMEAKKEETNQSLAIVTTKNNAKAIATLSQLMQKLDVSLNVLKADFNKAVADLKIANEYYCNNQAYLTNKAIIEGIRNAIAHGNYEVKSGVSIEDASIVFSDIYESKLTFRCEVKIVDFIDLLDANFKLVYEFINNKNKAEKTLN
ncbi:MAG: hypothetical protein IJB71_03935 [Bacilli bacterium]|nr:hypothetical protein [Bacilli bacterium]